MYFYVLTLAALHSLVLETWSEGQTCQLILLGGVWVSQLRALMGQPGQPTTPAMQGPGLEQRLLLLLPLRFVGQKLEESGMCPQLGPTSGHLPPASPCQPETFHVPHPGLHACPYHMPVTEFPGCHTL